MSNPDVRNMSPAQWAFEYYALRQKETEFGEAVAMNAKHMLVSLLGLNSLRPVDDRGIPKKPHEYTEEEKEAFLPLVGWIAHPEILKKVGEQMMIEKAATEAENNQAYEKMVEAIDAAGGDMEPILGPMDPEILKKLTPAKKYPGDNKASASNIDLVEDV